jgi:hypothetical protein
MILNQIKKFFSFKNFEKLTVEKNGNVLIAFSRNHQIYTQEYYEYCLALLKAQLFIIESPCNVIFGPYEFNFKNDNPTIRIAFQIEHTLVKRGGRGSGVDNNEGCIPVIGSLDEKYLVRIDSIAELQRADIIIDYSRTNIVNIKTSNRFPDLENKLFHLAPLLYEVPSTFEVDVKEDECITQFGDINQPRRREFLNNLNKYVKSENRSGVYRDVYKVYKRANILLNIHQTPDHHTPEELRILPALRSGCLVISEESPLTKCILYDRFVTWSTYSEIPQVAQKVLAEYESIYRKTIGSTFFKSRMKRMEKVNLLTAEKIAKKVNELAALASR